MEQADPLQRVAGQSNEVQHIVGAR
jgi:hypothetical protein